MPPEQDQKNRDSSPVNEPLKATESDQIPVSTISPLQQNIYPGSQHGEIRPSNSTEKNSQATTPIQLVNPTQDTNSSPDNQSIVVVGSEPESTNIENSGELAHDPMDSKRPAKRWLMLSAVIVSVLILGGVIFLILINHKPEKSNGQSSSQNVAKTLKSNKQPVKTVDSATGVSTTDWHSYSYPKFMFTYKYPPGDSAHDWKNVVQDQYSTTDSSGDNGAYTSYLELGLNQYSGYFPLDPFQVIIQPSNSYKVSDWLALFSASGIAQEQKEYPGWETISQQTVTKDGVSGTCYATTYSKIAYYGELYPAGYTETDCFFDRNELTYIIVYDNMPNVVQPSDPNLVGNGTSSDSDFTTIDNIPYAKVTQTIFDSLAFTSSSSQPLTASN